MQFELGRAENYRSWKIMDLNMGGFGRIFTVAGHNGAGKTTLCEFWPVLFYATAPSKGEGIAKYVRNVPSYGDKGVKEAMRKKKELPVLKMEGLVLHNGFRYRLVRTFDPNLKQSGHMLSLQRKPADAPADAWETEDGVEVLTAQTIPDTQLLIEQLFGNYRSFITSTFMGGGVSGFLDATDENREESAAFLFGCEGYDRRQQAASEKRLALERDLETKAANLPALLLEAGKASQLRLDMATIQTEIDKAKLDEEILRKAINVNGSEKYAVQVNASAAEAAATTAAGIRARITRLEAQAIELKALLTNQDELRAQAQRFKEARVTVQDQQRRYSETAELNKEIARLGQVIAVEKAKLVEQISQAESQLAQLPVIDAEADRKRMDDISHEIMGLGEIPSLISTAQGKVSALQELDAADRSTIRTKETRQTELRENIEALRAATGCCPTCERAFADDAERKKLCDKFIQEGVALKADIVALNKAISDRALQRIPLDKEIQQLHMDQIKQNNLSAEGVRLEQRIKLAAQVEQDRVALESRLDVARETLAINEYAESERHLLAAAQAKAETIGFNQETYSAALKTERELSGVETAIARLEKADADIEAVARQIETEQAALAAETAKTTSLEPLRAQLAELAEKALELQTELEEVHTRKNDAVSRLMTADKALAAAQQAGKDAEVITAGQADQRKRIAVLKVLEQAFKPQGIPSMKYSRYLPTLSNKVNYVLGILSPGWQISITSSISNRGKFVIPIEATSPEGLTDSYSSHSCGERFILALSFLIGTALFWGERTGAQPQHILIDEGFGSLDPNNLEKAKAAVASASVNFGQVGIISHLPELQSLGQVQLTVFKDGREGSKYEMAGVGSVTPRVRKHFMFEPDQWGAIATGIGVMKEAIPGMSDERAIEAAVVSTAQGVGAPKVKRGKKK